MTSAVDLIRGTTPSTRAGAGRAAGWRCPPEGERQRHPEKADGREGHCTWPDHCSRPSQPLAQSLRSASAPEGPERSGGGAERLAAVRIARTTLPGDGLGPARPGPNLPPPPLVDKHLWEVGEAVAPAGSPHRDCATAPRFPRLPQLHFLPNLNPCKKVESPSRARDAARRRCAVARCGAPRVPVWRPAFQAGRAMRLGRDAPLRGAEHRGAGLETGVPSRACDAARRGSAGARCGAPRCRSGDRRSKPGGRCGAAAMRRCAVRSTAVPVWRPAFQAGRASGPGGNPWGRRPARGRAAAPPPSRRGPGRRRRGGRGRSR